MTQIEYKNEQNNYSSVMCAECGNEIMKSQVIENENLPVCFYCNRKKIQKF